MGSEETLDRGKKGNTNQIEIRKQLYQRGFYQTASMDISRREDDSRS